MRIQHPRRRSVFLRHKPGPAQLGESSLPVRIAQIIQRVGELRDGWRGAQGGDGARLGRAVEQADHAEDGKLRPIISQPMFVALHHATSVAAVVPILFQQAHFAPARHIAAADIVQIGAEQGESQRVAAEVAHSGMQFVL